MNTLLLTALARAAQEFSRTIEAGMEEEVVKNPAPDTAKQPPAAPVAPAPMAQPVHASPEPVQPVQTAPSAQVVQMPQQSPPAAQAPAEAASELTLQQVQEIVGGYVQRMDDGKQAQLLQLIQSFGVDRVSALNPAHYGAFLQKAEEVANG